MLTFSLIWLGQFVSLIGSGLTSFALGVWVYQTTGSTTQFSLIYFFTELPIILIAPLAGAIADRNDKRKVMMMSDAGAGLSTVAIALLLTLGKLKLWHIYLAMGVNSTCNGFQLPAYYASPTLLVPKKQFGRANGMIQLAKAARYLVSPVLAGLLMGIIQLQGILLVDVFTVQGRVFAIERPNNNSKPKTA